MEQSTRILYRNCTRIGHHVFRTQIAVLGNAKSSFHDHLVYASFAPCRVGERYLQAGRSGLPDNPVVRSLPVKTGERGSEVLLGSTRRDTSRPS